MTAVRERIFQRVDQIYEALSGIAYERQPSGFPDTFPALAAHDGGQRKIEGEVGIDRWALHLIIEGFIEGSGGSATHTALNELHAIAVSSLMGDDDLAALVEVIEPGDLRVDVAEISSSRRIGFSQDMLVQFSTSRTDPALP